MMRFVGAVFVAGMMAALISGCGTSQSPPPQNGGGGNAEVHSHETGPHGGHLVELGDEEFHAEWLHDDNTGLVTLYILDGKATEPVQAGPVRIDVKIGAAADQHEMNAVGSTTGEAAAQFEVIDKSLIEALKMAGHGAEATLTVEIEGKSYTGVFEHHAH